MFYNVSSLFLKLLLLITYIAIHWSILWSNIQAAELNCCSVYGVHDVLVANCSDLNWTFVDLRCVPVTTEVLLLDRNNLTTLTNGSFQTLTSLQQLSIKSSNIQSIEIDTFLGLGQLQNLNIENNQLTDDVASLNPQAFRHLTHLKHLFVGNNQNLSQNLKDALVYLRNLSTLSMDGSETLQLGTEFSYLTQLNNLTLYCSKVTHVTNDSFIGLWHSNLTILNLINFYLLQFDPDYMDQDTLKKQFNDDAFQNLNSLEVLRIINCRIGNENMARKFKHLINSSLHTLYLEKTHYAKEFYTPNATFEYCILSTNTTQYLSQLTLSYFSWTNSDIFAVAPRVVSSPQWRYNIKSIDFSNNVMGWLGWKFTLLQAALLEKLEVVIITSPSPENEDSSPDLGLDSVKDAVQSPLLSNFFKSNTTPDKRNGQRLDRKEISTNNAFFQEAASYHALPEKNDSLHIEPLQREETFLFEANASHTAYVKLDSISERMFIIFSNNSRNTCTWRVRLPLSLRIVKFMFMLQGDKDYGNQSVQFFQTEGEAANVTHLYFVGNGITRGTGRIMGLANLQLLDLSKNALILSPYFFDDFPTLKYLILKSIKNEDLFRRVSIDRIIQNLIELRYLDLTDNKLNYLSPNLFFRNPHISHVILSKNRFTSLPLKMELCTSLKFLDLSGNAIIYLTVQETSSLTKHSENVPEFFFVLSENNIACVCSHFQFIKWIKSSDFLDKKGNYSCTSEEGLLISTAVLLQDVLGFYRQCYGYNYLMISIVLLLVMSFTFLMAYLVHRFRTAIEAYLVRIFVRAFRPMKSSDYKTHVFIGYADEDIGFVRHILLRYLEEDLKVSTFVHHRDLGPGYTDQQMFEAMRDSWRIMLVISQSFLNKYDLSDIIMKYASHSITPVNQGRVVLLVQQTQLYNIPGSLYDVLEDSRIIVISDLSAHLDYAQRQNIKECLRDIH
ncbi:TLR cluster1 member 4 [Biomphalaria glabrata]|nr:toll-like receptor 4; transcript variant X1; misc_RNA Pattern recognition/Resistant factor [Biomphalaria glabrata]